jgi:hypothetical protein
VDTDVRVQQLKAALAGAQGAVQRRGAVVAAAVAAVPELQQVMVAAAVSLMTMVMMMTMMQRRSGEGVGNDAEAVRWGVGGWVGIKRHSRPGF